jgi:hypothetical protein
MIKAAQIVQNCYVVRDIEVACTRMRKLYHIGPFVGGNEIQLTDHIYRGKPVPPIKIRVAFVQAGELNIELIQLVSETPSALHDMFNNGGEGFHHVAKFCDDYEAERDAFVEAGYPVASEFRGASGVQICYIDARNGFGHMIELYPEVPAIRALYAQVRNASQNWNGKDLFVSRR